MSEVKLLPWQERIVNGMERSLAVPAGARTGKTRATVFAMKKRPTLTVVPTESMLRLVQREAMYFGVHPDSEVWAWEEFVFQFFERKIPKKFPRFAQVIFDEVHRADLMTILRFRDRFGGRIVVTGTPMDLPCPIFFPLSKMPEWEFCQVTHQIAYPRPGVEKWLHDAKWTREIDGEFKEAAHVKTENPLCQTD